MSDSIRQMYHTQERRVAKLNKPIQCTREDAWLGNAYYFWDDFKDAQVWGEKAKTATGEYEIYSANIDCSNILDTVFNEEQYNFWLIQVEKTAIKIVTATGKKPSIYELNRYFKERASWNEVDGILFQDLPKNNNMLLVLELWYRKRIQLAVYNLTIINNFVFLKSGRC